MGVRVHFNPSTLKAHYNKKTGKAMVFPDCDWGPLWNCNCGAGGAGMRETASIKFNGVIRCSTGLPWDVINQLHCLEKDTGYDGCAWSKTIDIAGDTVEILYKHFLLGGLVWNTLLTVLSDDYAYFARGGEADCVDFSTNDNGFYTGHPLFDCNDIWRGHEILAVNGSFVIWNPYKGVGEWP